MQRLGVAQPPGSYTIKVTATDASGNPVAVTQQSSGLITGVTFQNGVTHSSLAARLSRLATSIKFRQPATRTNNRKGKTP